eukprot:5535088-Amphidinium_carterae.1
MDSNASEQRQAKKGLPLPFPPALVSALAITSSRFCMSQKMLFDFRKDSETNVQCNLYTLPFSLVQ